MSTTTVAQSLLPRARGNVSDALISALNGSDIPLDSVPLDQADPLGGDVQLALAIAYELHYRGFREVSDSFEWDPRILTLRNHLEVVFLDALRANCSGSTDVRQAVSEVVKPSGPPRLSCFVESRASWEQVKELFVHRSIYHLKEADPHAWAIPRLTGRAKAALVAVEFDEYGGGRAEAMHSKLFVDLLEAAGLSSDYLGYIDVVPPESLATVNFMSTCGLKRQLRGALVGMFAAAEISTAPSARRILDGLIRLDAPGACRYFYSEHIEADAVHEQVLRHEVIDPVVTEEPHLAGDIVFGIEASEYLETRFSDRVLSSWDLDQTSLC